MRQEYWHYITAYGKKFDVLKYIKYNHEVVLLEREPGTTRWVIETVHMGKRQREVFDAVAVCTGTHQIENVPKFEGQETFEGVIEHTSAYKNNDRFAGKHVVCVGAGESAADIIKEISDVSASCVMSVRRPPTVIPRFPEKNIYTNDMYTSRFHHYPNYHLTDILHYIHYYMTYYFDPCPKYRKIAELALKSGGGESRQFLTKNENFISNLVNGKCEVRPGISRLHKDRVYFTDGTSVKCDTIMLCTGYIDEFSFLKATTINNVREMYKHVWHPHLDWNVAFIGWARPATGGVPVCSEMQARLFALLCSGKRTLPANWRQALRKENDWEQNRFYLSGRIKTLVQYGKYMESFAEIIGCKPGLRTMFFTNPYLWYRCWFGPHYSFQYRLRGPHACPEVVLPVLYNHAPNPWPLWAMVANLFVTGVSICTSKIGLFPTAW